MKNFVSTFLAAALACAFVIFGKQAYDDFRIAKATVANASAVDAVANAVQEKLDILNSEPAEVISAKRILESNLKDPASVVYGEFAIINPNLVCIRANSKNEIGGYGGETSYIVKVDEEGVMAAKGLSGKIQILSSFDIDEQLEYSLNYYSSCSPEEKASP